MRLFAAVFPSEAALRSLVALQRDLKRHVDAPCSWTRAERIHLTLRFFGDDAEPSATARELEQAVAGATAGNLVLDQCGGFPNARRARVLFVGSTSPDERVLHIARTLGERDREPVPHVTIGRPRRTVQVPGVEFDPIQFEVRQVALVHSILAGPETGYHILETWTLPR